MNNLYSLPFFDLGTILCMIVLAFLSKRLGDALKLKPYYKTLYVTAIGIASSLTIDIVSSTFHFTSLSIISMSIRFVACGLSFIICLIYWNWLFSEILKN
jgi:chromate transport protein ChrA